MHVSEARVAANRINGSLSLGPVSDPGKSAARRNSLRHGLTGSGKVVPEGDVDLIRARVEALTLEMQPRTEAGSALITMMATLSVRMGRAAEHESAAIAYNVRHAADAFDDERLDRVDALFAGLADDPRAALRKLKRMPEGVEKLIEAWDDLKADLTLEAWADDQLERAANLAGLKSRHAGGSRFAALNRAIRGDFEALGTGDGPGIDEAARKAWARSELVMLIDREVEALEAHYETLDFESLALDRAEAGQRALFDASKAASLARRYESEARRGFFKALKEFRQVEAEFAAQAEAAQAPPQAPQSRPTMGSSRQIAPPPPREPARPSTSTDPADDFFARGEAGRPSVGVPAVKTPG